MTAKTNIINEKQIENLLSVQKINKSEIENILLKARELKGLNIDEVAKLTLVEDEDLIKELFETARFVKETIYGSRLVIFAPLYVSNLCANECTYCAFRAKNTSIARRALNQSEISREAKYLIDQGQKRVLLVAGESYPKEGLEYILKAIDTVYNTKSKNGDIRRINVNIAPLSTDDFKKLKAKNIGTYQIFQETYHHETYSKVHVGGKKKDYDWRITAIDRAMEAGIDDVGIGVLFGLYDWKFELLALMQHTKYLENKYGVGPHTISVPRLEPATGSDISEQPPYELSDINFKKLMAIIRVAVPYTGLILSTRESVQTRKEGLSLGVSQISAGSKTDPGGYEEGNEFDSSQFSLGDHRTLEEVIKDIISMGYMPSFCTGCYRLGRTGADFMDLAKPGDIKNHCDPNGISTFAEYLIDYASSETREQGLKLIEETISKMNGIQKERALKLYNLVKSGKRDVYC